jgi:hypothetical protein
VPVNALIIVDPADARRSIAVGPTMHRTDPATTARRGPGSGRAA